VSQTSAALAASVRELGSRAEAQRARLQRTIDRQRAQIKRAAETNEMLRGQWAAGAWGHWRLDDRMRSEQQRD